MPLRSIEDIENQIEQEIISGANERYKDEDDREYILVFDAKNSIAAEMAAGLLADNHIETLKKSNDARGVFGVAMFPPALYVPAEDFERAFDILSECGFFDEPGADENEPGGGEAGSFESNPNNGPDANEQDDNGETVIEETGTGGDNNDSDKI